MEKNISQGINATEFFNLNLDSLNNFCEWYENNYNKIKQNYEKKSIMSAGEINELEERKKELDNLKMILSNPDYLSEYIHNIGANRIINSVNNLFDLTDKSGHKISNDGVVIANSESIFTLEILRQNGYHIESIPENATKLDIINIIASSVGYDFTPYNEMIIKQINTVNHIINLNDQFEIDTDRFLKNKKENKSRI